MDIFSQYLQPVTLWISHHPHWALFATFIISLSESLAIVGSIVPGTVTMTAFGILAGSGIMRVDLTLLAATLGAIAGDSLSYFIGYFYSEQIINMWPFRRYPTWIQYGKDYFNHHGGKSVFIGRFTGPLRSIIPIIAGMLKMNHWHFIIANVSSAIGWAFLYVIPGVLIGAASIELSAPSASKLFIVILCFLAIIWATTLGIKWLFTHTNQWLHTHCNLLWKRLLHSKYLGRWARFLTPPTEVDHYATAAMVLILISFVIFIPLIFMTYHYHQWTHDLNEAVYLFCLSIRTFSFDKFFIIVRLDIGYVSLFCFFMSIIMYAIYHRDWRLLRFWVSLFVVSLMIVIFMSYFLHTPLPINHTSDVTLFTYPTRELTFATSLYGFLVFYMASFYQQTISVVLRIFLLTSLFLAGIALVYLGEDWIMNIIIAYKIGFTNALFHWVFYRRRTKPHYRSYLPINLSIILLIIATALSALFFITPLSDKQQPTTRQYDIRHYAWWNQNRPLLPMYSYNRFGKEIGVMNLQYVGSIQHLQQTLEQAGWKKQLDSFFYSLLLRITDKKSVASLPLMAQLYANNKPYILMSYGSKDQENGLIIRFWRSNFHVHNQEQTIWIGSVQTQHGRTTQNPSELINQLASTLKAFKTRTVIINPKKIRPNSATSTILLLIKENP
jgi:membrane protein DedA with SNARE-associated domain